MEVTWGYSPSTEQLSGVKSIELELYYREEGVAPGNNL